MCCSFFCYKSMPQRFLTDTRLMFAGSLQAVQSDGTASDMLWATVSFDDNANSLAAPVKVEVGVLSQCDAPDRCGSLGYVCHW